MAKSLSRRQLLRGVSATAVGVAVAGCLTVPPTSPDDTEPRHSPRQQGSHGGPHGSMTHGDGPHGQPGSHHGQGGPHHGQDGPHHGQSGAHHGRTTDEIDASGTLADWFANVDDYTGPVDRTGQSAVTVTVGAAGNGGAFAYDPPAIRIDRGTTVTWEWTGEGGSHDVVAVDDTFESDLASAAGTTFTHSFDEAGTHRYYCTPHRSLGMKGAVVVE